LTALNVLVDKDDVAKVAHFGLAKEAELGGTESGKLPIKWTAPEVIRNKVSTSKSDGKSLTLGCPACCPLLIPTRAPAC